VSEAFIGAGWSYPVRTEASGDIALVTGDEELSESIRLIIGTALGERPMRPEFGCAIHDFVFAGVDQNVAGQIAYEVRQSLLRWEPRVDVSGVEVTVDDLEQSLLYIDIAYSRKGTNDPRNLVFPFYVIPEEG
jgi:phage baseplate assembly protein W